MKKTRSQLVFNKKAVITCSLCPYRSNRKSNFERHMKSMHQLFEDDPFQCCGQTFLSKAQMKIHSKESHGEGYRCEWSNCDKVFPRKALLRRHETVHTGIKEFSCPKCNYKTSHKSNLERHCHRVHKLVIRGRQLQKNTTVKPKSPKKPKSVWIQNFYKLIEV